MAAGSTDSSRHDQYAGTRLNGNGLNKKRIGGGYQPFLRSTCGNEGSDTFEDMKVFLHEGCVLLFA